MHKDKLKKKKTEPTAELRDAHTTLLRVSTQETLRNITNQTKAFSDAVAVGDLKAANEALSEVSQLALLARKEVLHSANQLGISIYDDDDDDDE